MGNLSNMVQQVSQPQPQQTNNPPPSYVPGVASTASTNISTQPQQQQQPTVSINSSVNPYDIKASTGGTGLLSNAMNSTAQVQPASYSAAQTGAAGYNSVDTGSQGYAGATVGLNGGNSVVDTLSNITDTNSPVMQRAQNRGLELANSRGLLNSSLAVGAAQNAVYDQAIPLAQADASLRSQNAQFNANSTNQANQFTAGAMNNASLSNQSARNQSLQYNAGAQNQANLSNQQAINQALQTNTANSQQAALSNQQSINSFVNLQMDQALKTALSSADNQTKVDLQNIDAATRTNLANIEANYKTILQSSASASDYYKQIAQNISAIIQNKDLDKEAKNDAIVQQSQLLQGGLAIIGGIGNLNLNSLLSFPTPAA